MGLMFLIVSIKPKWAKCAEWRFSRSPPQSRRRERFVGENQELLLLGFRQARPSTFIDWARRVLGYNTAEDFRLLHPQTATPCLYSMAVPAQGKIFVHYNHADSCSRARWTAKFVSSHSYFCIFFIIIVIVSVCVMYLKIELVMCVLLVRECYNYLYERDWQGVAGFYSGLVNGRFSLSNLFGSEVVSYFRFDLEVIYWSYDENWFVGNGEVMRWHKNFGIFICMFGQQDWKGDDMTKNLNFIFSKKS